MDRISGLADELLVKILSFAPTKVAVSTSILSKRWEFLWMWLPKLEYVNSDPVVRDFIDKNLPLHRAPVIESLRLELRASTKPEDIKRWVGIAVSRYVRELDIIDFPEKYGNIFPSSFYTSKSLVILKLELVTLEGVPTTACLHSLKTLQLRGVKYADEKSLQLLLSICPVLEELSVHLYDNDENMEEFTIVVPSLQSLSLFIPADLFLGGYEIDTPSLKYFKLEDLSYVRHSEIKNMPKLREAYVDVRFHNLESVFRSITSVKRLTICSEILQAGGKNVYGGGFVFDQLDYLKLCVCKKESSNLLAQLLKYSPKLQVLDVSDMKDHGHDERNKMVCWNQPSTVPECMLTSLEIFNWKRYFGRKRDRDIAVYILKNACCLKTATFVADTFEYSVPNLKMIKELTLSSRASSTCELVFVEGYHVLATEETKNGFLGEILSNWSLMYSIMLRLDAFEILENVQKVCTSWRRVSKESSMWRKIDMRNLITCDLNDYDLGKMCRHAIDRSEGGLIEIRISFISIDLLTYIAHRAPNLRSLGLELNYLVTNDGFVNAIAKLSLLEELEVLCTWSKHDLKAIGHSCPKLNTSKLICFSSKQDSWRRHDDDAYQIAGSMPKLRHLQLINNNLTNFGLTTILHHCPHLEHLDLRKCWNIKLSGDMEKRCLEKIKDFRRPNDSTADCPFHDTLSDTHSSEEEEVYEDGDNSVDSEDDDYSSSSIQLTVMSKRLPHLW